ncbi:MAG TPA: hypothetical protein VMV92_39850 [Streptosporangiaceae bacterium]|nr:hypothetical protein [Streptosporangiaceae bacterium]
MITLPASCPAASSHHPAAGARRYDAGDLRHPQALARIRELLAGEGLAIFRGTRGRGGVLRAAGTVLTVLPHPDAGPDGITVITDLGAAGDHPGAGGFSRRELTAHTDRPPRRPC